VGKGTLIKRLLERVDGLSLAVSATTRTARPGEREGVDYHFLSVQDFERRVAAGEFVEHAVYAGNRYGTLRSELQRPGRGIVLEIDVQGARQVRETLPGAVRIFVEPPSFAELRTRLAGGDLRIARANDQVRSVLKITSLDRVLRPYATVDEATAGY